MSAFTLSADTIRLIFIHHCNNDQLNTILHHIILITDADLSKIQYWMTIHDAAERKDMECRELLLHAGKLLAQRTSETKLF
jgi:hypothetical protein